MMGMASGADYIKGSFTTGNTSGHRISFGKTFSKYIYFVEMTEESKATLMASGQDAHKMVACCGIYPRVMVGDVPVVNGFASYRVNPTTSATSQSTSAALSSIDNTSIVLPNSAITGGSNSLYRGYSYNYYVVEIK